MNIKSPLKQSDGVFLIYLNWQVPSEGIRGNEDDFKVQIAMVVPNTGFGMDVNNTNNAQEAVIPVNAASNYAVTL